MKYTFLVVKQYLNKKKAGLLSRAIIDLGATSSPRRMLSFVRWSRDGELCSKNQGEEQKKDSRPSSVFISFRFSYCEMSHVKSLQVIGWTLLVCSLLGQSQFASLSIIMIASSARHHWTLAGCIQDPRILRKYLDTNPSNEWKNRWPDQSIEIKLFIAS